MKVSHLFCISKTHKRSKPVKRYSIVISHCFLTEHHFLEKLRNLLRRFIKASLDPFIQKTKQTIGVESCFVALGRIRPILGHHYLIKSVINTCLKFCSINFGKKIFDGVVKGKEVFRIVQRIAVSLLNFVLVRPAIPEAD